MRTVVELLVRARTAGVVIVLLLLSGVMAVAVQGQPWRTVFMAIAVGALATVLLIIVALQKKEMVQGKAVSRAIGRNQRETTKALKARDGEFATLRDQIDDLRNQIRDGQVRATETEQVKQLDPVSFFSPNRVLSHKILDRPSSQQAGRNAANQVAAGDATEILEEMLVGTDADWERSVVAVCSPALRERLSQMATVEPLQPGLLIGHPVSSLAYVVLDERYLNSGVWSGTLDTVGTGEFLALKEYLNVAKQKGALIIVKADSVKSHFNDELRALADIVVADGKSDLRWEPDVNLPILNLLIEESVEI